MAHVQADLTTVLGFGCLLALLAVVVAPRPNTGMTRAQERKTYTVGGSLKNYYGDESICRGGEPKQRPKQSFNSALDKEPVNGCVKQIEDVDHKPFEGHWLPAELYCVCINRAGKKTTDEVELKMCRLQAELLNQAKQAVFETPSNKVDDKARKSPPPVFIKGTQIDTLRILCAAVEWDQADSRLSLYSQCGQAQFTAKVKWTSKAGKLANRDGDLRDIYLSSFFYKVMLTSLDFSAVIEFAADGKTATKVTWEVCSMIAKPADFYVATALMADDSTPDFPAGKATETASKIADQLGLVTPEFSDKQRDIVCKMLLQAVKNTVKQLAKDKHDLPTIASAEVTNEDMF